MRFNPNDAEKEFAKLLLGDGPQKVAAELQPETADLLGIPSVSPRTLNQLEQGAAQQTAAEADPGERQEIPEEQLPPEEPAPQQQAAPAGQPPQPPVEEPSSDFDQEPAPDEEDEDALSEPELPSRMTHGSLFSSKRAHPLQMFEVLNMRYEAKWGEWESETLFWALRRDFGPVGDLSRNKVQALRLAATTDMTWLDWDVFEDSGLAWNDVIPIIGKFQPMSPAQTAFAVEVLRGIRDDEEFSHEVNTYIAAILVDHGYVYAPEGFFAGAQDIISKSREDLLPLQVEVQRAWEGSRETDPSTIQWDPENPVDVHVLKLHAVQRYLSDRDTLRSKVSGTSVPATAAPPIPSVP